MNQEAKHSSPSELKQLYGLSFVMGALWGVISLYEQWQIHQDTLTQFRLEKALIWFDALASRQEIQNAALICQTLWLGTLAMALLSQSVEFLHSKKTHVSQG